MAETENATDQEIVTHLERMSKNDSDYWTFRGRSNRKQAQGLVQYPAMMVPEMQAVLVKILVVAHGRVRRVYDPFAGCGTTLVESMRLGLDFVGQDINPLAVLFCRTKSGPFHIHRLRDSVEDVVRRAKVDRGRRFEANFPGLRKWFSLRAVTELSRIRRAIRSVDHSWCRRVLWTGLAETIRLNSNSRTSTFKLHVRDSEELRERQVQPLQTFETIVSDIGRRLNEEARVLRDKGYLTKGGHYRGEVEIRMGDSTAPQPDPETHDLVVTSPPYGDNTTTVPYGQYSYLPLQWIDLQDVDSAAVPSLVRSAYEIDTRSLGGSRRNAMNDVEELLQVCPSLRATLKCLEGFPSDRRNRVAAFVRDLNASLDAVVAALKPGGYMIWTIGNRRVGGKPVPSDRILCELLAVKDVRAVARLDRQIPSKRMAKRNPHASTMCREAILVFGKG